MWWKQNGVAVLDGFSMDASVHINKAPGRRPVARGLRTSVDGGVQPGFRCHGLHLDDVDGTHTLKEPWEGHSKVSRTQRRRNDLVVGSLALTDLISIRMWSTDFPSNEGITWYGPAAQWNLDGIKHSGHYNNILFGVHSPQGSGWYMNGGMGNLYMTKERCRNEGYAHSALQEVARGVCLRGFGCALVPGYDGRIAPAREMRRRGDPLVQLPILCCKFVKRG